MRRLKSLHVMREVITIVEMGMAVMHAAQKFPGGIVTCLIRSYQYHALRKLCLPRRHPDHEEDHGHH